MNNKIRIDPLSQADFYKTGHIFQYPEGTQQVSANFTPRSARLAPVLWGEDGYDNKIVWFGLQGYIKTFLIETWNENFFKLPKEKVLKRYQRRLDNALGKGAVPVDHIAALHDLGYLPIEIKSLPEGSRVNMRVPPMTIVNTDPRFFWLTNYIETVTSNELWKPSTVATIAYEYRRLLTRYADLTGAPKEFIDWQGHDFSCRGMSGMADSMSSSAGHLLSFFGTDTIAAIDYLEDWYGADSDKELIGGSVPATEHSVMCMGGLEDELGTFRRLITEVYPSGIVSIVSDTWDFFKVITEFTVALKDEILARSPDALGNAKVVFRPDSGDPVKILCGYTADEVSERQEDGTYLVRETGRCISDAERKGAVECLWEVFGGSVTDKGYKVLNARVGLIYGDSITLARAEAILKQLMAKRFASCNTVFGIGSYTYQFLTRDSFGWAVKATAGIVNGEFRVLFKDPATDSGTKRSAAGYLRVEKEGRDFVLYDNQTPEQEKMGELKTVFLNGRLMGETTLAEIRSTLQAA